MFGGIEARMAAQKDDIVGVAELAASVAVPAAQCGRVVWSGHGGSLRRRSVSAGVVLRRPALLAVGLFAGHAA